MLWFMYWANLNCLHNCTTLKHLADPHNICIYQTNIFNCFHNNNHIQLFSWYQSYSIVFMMYFHKNPVKLFLLNWWKFHYHDSVRRFWIWIRKWQHHTWRKVSKSFLLNSLITSSYEINSSWRHTNTNLSLCIQILI